MKLQRLAPEGATHGIDLPPMEVLLE
jgi:hypothetical protein